MKRLLLSAFAAALIAGTAAAQNSKTLVVYFSLAGEQYNVGNIKEGNTEIVAKMIADETGADLFKIETSKPYTTSDHRTLLNEAKDELSKKARPALKADKDISGYGTIYVGYPIWWGDMPMALYTFLEGKNWSGKTVVPFCTHEGSGLSGTESKIRSVCKGAKVLKGLAIRGRTAQTDRSAARKQVQEWTRQIQK